MTHSRSWISAVRKAGLAPCYCLLVSVQEKRPEFDIVKLPSQAHGWGKLPWKGASEFTCDSNCYLNHGYSHCSKQNWEKGVNSIVLVEPVAKLFPVSGFRLHSVWTEARCAGQLMSERELFTMSTDFYWFWPFRCLKQCCNNVQVTEVSFWLVLRNTCWN